MSFTNHRAHHNISGTTLMTIFLMLTTIQYLPLVSGGICWYKMETEGYCKETLKYNVSKEKCCAGSSTLTAYSPDNLRDDTIFILRTLDRGVPCKPCKGTCDGVKCGKNKKCMMKNDRPVCVCSPKCKSVNIRKGPVCGSDNKSYKSACRLKKQRCRNNDPLLRVNYNGLCQSSCKNVKCKRGKYCIQDQNMNSHCVSCNFACIHSARWKAPVCGDNGVTYQSTCHLLSAACYSGKTTTVAYRDTCKTNATCNTIGCSHGEKCLVQQDSGLPKCVPCSSCQENKRVHQTTGILCGNNNQTYYSWCDMINDSCNKGYVVEPVSSGSCELRKALDYNVVRKY